jgi:acetyl-CoA carboxylase biotin carboxylase subunit
MSTRKIQRVLIANRGEIAVRVTRACREMGIEAVAVYSEIDRAAAHVRAADIAVPLGGKHATDSYLRIDKVLDAARGAGCDAVHPGYGFLAENAAFADACASAGLAFCGPSGDAMRLMGDKVAARREAVAAGVPIAPGGIEPVSDAQDLERRAAETGYPLLLKAAAGGGGKGIRVVEDPAKLHESFARASGEAQSAFGDGSVYMERFISRARHVEVQVLADAHGAVVHLGERECSLQRRNQKLVEETPSPSISDGLRRDLCAAAVALARRIGYESAGTVEFLVEGAGTDAERFYFMEMNTRLQVEHPVTEMVTGIDLVREQLRIAAGEPLRWNQDDVRPRGASIEVRLYAEDPEHGFRPSIGRIQALDLPAGPWTRVDMALAVDDEISPYYDPMIGKLITWGRDRDEATSRMLRALREMRIVGVATTAGLLDRLLSSDAFREAAFDTRFLEPFTQQSAGALPDRAALERLAIACAVRAAERERAGAIGGGSSAGPGGNRGSAWARAGRIMQLGGGMA